MSRHLGSDERRALRRAQKEKNDRRTSVICFTVVALIVLAAIGTILYFVLRGGRSEKANDAGQTGAAQVQVQDDTELILGVWVQDDEAFRFTFERGKMTIDKKIGGVYEFNNEREYSLIQSEKALMMATAEGKADRYGYELQNDSLTLTKDGRSWTFYRVDG